MTVVVWAGVWVCKWLCGPLSRCEWLCGLISGCGKWLGGSVWWIVIGGWGVGVYVSVLVGLCSGVDSGVVCGECGCSGVECWCDV